MFKHSRHASTRSGPFESISIDLLAGYVILVAGLAGGAFLILRDVGLGVIRSRAHGDIWYSEQPILFVLALTGGVIGALIPAAMALFLARAVVRRLAGQPGGISLLPRYRNKRGA
jgi:hypothetical protein